MPSVAYDRSWATEPLFYKAPHPPNMTPKQYQFAGVEYALQREHCLIGDAPGLGKTAESIMLGNAIEAEYTLVVCPASLRLNWEREIWKWSTIPNVSTYPVLKAKDGVSERANYVMVSYNLLSNPSILNAIMSVRWDHLIMDEAHAIKDPKGNKRSTILTAPDLIPAAVDRITMLSGTILPNQPIECYNAIRLLNWDAIDRMSVEQFREHYYAIGSGYIRGPHEVKLDSGEVVTRSELHWSNNVRNVPRNLDELQLRLRENVMDRRLKEQVLHELPAKQWHPFPLSLTPGIRKVLKHSGWKQAEKLYEMNPNAFDASVPIDGDIATARRELGEAKAPSVADFVEELLLEGAQKIVLSAWHRSVLSLLRERLSKHGLV